jgi:hypothetical protein
MERYFFHLVENGSQLDDPEGRVFLNDLVAQQAAVAEARTLMAEDLLLGQVSMASYIDVVGSTGKRVAQVYFEDAVSFLSRDA